MNNQRYWTHVIENTTCFDIWNTIVKQIFDDGVVNPGRLIVLHAYTLDVVSNLSEKERESSPTGREADSHKILRHYIRDFLSIPT